MHELQDRGDPLRVTEWDTMKSLFSEAADLPAESLPAFIASKRLDSGKSDRLLHMLARRSAASSLFAELSAELTAFANETPCLRDTEIIGGRFRIERFLARGGMGEVYQAEDLELGGDFALKVMRPGLAAHPGGLKRFREEIRLARKVVSPYVCRLYDVGRHACSEGDFLFFTMELLQGETIGQRLAARGAIRFDEAKPLIGQILAGLTAAHERGVIHRDLKSSNVFLCESQTAARAVITDFGLSRVLQETNADPMLDGLTPEYMAPEVIEGESATVASDIYSFGVVAAEMLTGDIPSGSTEFLALPGSPSAWQKTIRKCLEADPADRFSSAQEVARQLGFAPAKAINRRVFAVSVGLAIAGTGAVIWSSFAGGARSNERRRTIAVLPFRSEASLEYLAAGMADRLADGLNRVPGVQVVSRGAAARLKSKDLHFSEAREQLKCDYFLSGSLEGTEDAFRVHMEVSDAVVGVSKWSGTFDAAPNEAALIPEQALRAIIPQLEWESGPEVFRSASAPTRNAAAYRNYLIGRFLADKRDIESLRESIVYFEHSIRLDNRFAAAYAALAHSCC